jgi:hypothetical protein
LEAFTVVVVYPFSPADQDLAHENAKWMNELGGCKGHEVVAIADARCQQAVFIVNELKKCFDNVYVLPAKAVIDGWPEGANYFFRTATAWLGNAPKWPCFLWMEPDAVPLRKSWLDLLEAEYKACGKRFMGDRVQVENIPLHMSGVGIYPNPLHAYAGEAYRASETAWDMAGKDQIVPQAHFTKLIEHAWRHPVFTNPSELKTQIRPETILFHSSKDGSLIKLLREKLFPAVPVLAEPETVKVRPKSSIGDKSGEARESTKDEVAVFDSRGVGETKMAASGERQQSGPELTGTAGVPAEFTTGLRDDPLAASIGGDDNARSGQTRFTVNAPPTVQPASGAEISCDIFIRTYPGDYEWLSYCVRSIEKFARGFRKVWIVSPEPIFLPANMPGFETKMINDESEDGYLAQQITKLYADVITDYQADYILHIDSDTLLTRPITPENFFSREGLPVWLYTPYSEIQTPWQPVTEKFMGEAVEYEFMRRFPILVPKWLLSRIREFCHATHGMVMTNYIKMQPYRSFSEFNALGAFAYRYHRSMFQWINTVKDLLQEPFGRQFHSWSGITDEVKKEINYILNGADQPAREAVSSIAETQPVHYTTQTSATPCPAPSNSRPYIKELVMKLKEYADTDTSTRISVMVNLQKAGLTPRRQKKK